MHLVNTYNHVFLMVHKTHFFFCGMCVGGTQRLPKLVGAGKAKQMIFMAQILSGAEAHEIGLVEEVVPANKDGNAAYLKALEIAVEIGTKV